ncbi:MAG: hypothetical protein JO149_07430, partial [Gammaproteobacteria bacterium]|nr:hypothetical protein [Gammaproteobacteria bacterium]
RMIQAKTGLSFAEIIRAEEKRFGKESRDSGIKILEKELMQNAFQLIDKEQGEKVFIQLKTQLIAWLEKNPEQINELLSFGQDALEEWENIQEASERFNNLAQVLDHSLNSLIKQEPSYEIHKPSIINEKHFIQYIKNAAFLQESASYFQEYSILSIDELKQMIGKKALAFINNYQERIEKFSCPPYTEHLIQELYALNKEIQDDLIREANVDKILADLKDEHPEQKWNIENIREQLLLSYSSMITSTYFRAQHSQKDQIIAGIFRLINTKQNIHKLPFSFYDQLINTDHIKLMNFLIATYSYEKSLKLATMIEDPSFIQNKDNVTCLSAGKLIRGEAAIQATLLTRKNTDPNYMLIQQKKFLGGNEWYLYYLNDKQQLTKRHLNRNDEFKNLSAVLQTKNTTELTFENKRDAHCIIHTFFDKTKQLKQQKMAKMDDLIEDTIKFFSQLSPAAHPKIISRIIEIVRQYHACKEEDKNKEALWIALVNICKKNQNSFLQHDDDNINLLCRAIAEHEDSVERWQPTTLHQLIIAQKKQDAIYKNLVAELVRLEDESETKYKAYETLIEKIYKSKKDVPLENILQEGQLTTIEAALNEKRGALSKLGLGVSQTTATIKLAELRDEASRLNPLAALIAAQKKKFHLPNLHQIAAVVSYEALVNEKGKLNEALLHSLLTTGVTNIVLTTDRDSLDNANALKPYGEKFGFKVTVLTEDANNKSELYQFVFSKLATIVEDIHSVVVVDDKRSSLVIAEEAMAANQIHYPLSCLQVK